MEKDIHSLKPTTKNPRELTVKVSQQMDGSMAEFGDLSGIVYNINKDMNELVGGNQRTTKFKADATAKVIITERLDEPNSVGTVAWGYVLIGDERFNYREVDWPKSKHRAAVIAANKIHGEFDTDMLAEELYDLKDDDAFMFELTGFDEVELDALQDGFVEHDEAGPKDKEKRWTIEELKTERDKYFDVTQLDDGGFVAYLEKNYG